MKRYVVKFQKEASKFLKRQDRKTQQRLLLAINQLPNGTDIKKLQGHDLYRLRVGDYRIIYAIDETIKVIMIDNIDNRGDVYKKY